MLQSNRRAPIRHKEQSVGGMVTRRTQQELFCRNTVQTHSTLAIWFETKRHRSFFVCLFEFFWWRKESKINKLLTFVTSLIQQLSNQFIFFIEIAVYTTISMIYMLISSQSFLKSTYSRPHQFARAFPSKGAFTLKKHFVTKNSIDKLLLLTWFPMH